MILVDTSLWIRFLANRAPYAAELDALLSRDEVVGHEFVFGELLIGDRGGRKKLLALYEQMRQASMAPHRDVVAFVRSRGLHGRGVGWIDIHLLASAILGRFQLWTADPKISAPWPKTLGLLMSLQPEEGMRTLQICGDPARACWTTDFGSD